MPFLWDVANRSHLARHDISPEEAEQVLNNDPLDMAVQVINGEKRTPQVGETNAGRILVIVSMQHGDDERIVTGWDAPKAEKAIYLQYRARQTWRPQ